MRLLFLVLSDASRQAWADSLIAAAGADRHEIFTGTIAQASQHLAAQKLAPSNIVLDIGARGQDVLPEIDQLAQHCEPGTRVIAVGDANDIHLYRGLLARGIIDYLPMPANPNDLLTALRAPAATPAAAPVASNGTKRVITFFSAASGDGASTAALNSAFALSQLFNGTTVLVDMDYQYGMAAKSLDLQNQYGISDLFDHPDRGIDITLIRRMVANYGKLHVITAPAELRYLPDVSADAVRDLVNVLKQSYDNIILDMPHVWLPWVATACQQSTHIVLITQLWLKSVSHAARMVRAFRDMNIPLDRVITVVNRSGAKFKEAIDPKDLERVSNTTIRYTLSNDIRTVTAAEGAARTILEMEPSALGQDILRLARGLAGLPSSDDALPESKSGGGLLSSLLKKRD